VLGVNDYEDSISFFPYFQAYMFMLLCNTCSCFVCIFHLEINKPSVHREDEMMVD